ncbi:MAG: FxsA family protein [Mariprofundaceae bacterium]
MIRLFFIAVISMLAVELYLLIEVGSNIGGLSTILLCIATAAIGIALVKKQGLQALVDAQQAIQRREEAGQHLQHGIIIALCGLMLLIPGFFTDCVAFLLLIPSIRGMLLKNRRSPEPKKEWVEAEVVEQHDHLKKE